MCDSAAGLLAFMHIDSYVLSLVLKTQLATCFSRKTCRQSGFTMFLDICLWAGIATLITHSIQWPNLQQQSSMISQEDPLYSLLLCSPSLPVSFWLSVTQYKQAVVYSTTGQGKSKNISLISLFRCIKEVSFSLPLFLSQLANLRCSLVSSCLCPADLPREGSAPFCPLSAALWMNVNVDGALALRTGGLRLVLITRVCSLLHELVGYWAK